MDTNRLIEKFKGKSTAELQQIIDSPTSFEPEAVSAAKHLLSDPAVESEAVKPAIQRIYNYKALFIFKKVLDIGVVLFLILALARILKQEIFGDVILDITNRINLNGWCSIACGTGAYVFYLVHKWWLTGRDKYNEDVARGEIVKHWMLICALVFASLFFLLQ